MGVDRWLHAHSTEQLQRVVLDHVTQGASGVIKSTTLFNAQLFGNRDLDIGNGFTPPERLKQGIAKAQCKQVLHRRFAQVMVNPENLLFTECAAHAFIDGAV